MSSKITRDILESYLNCQFKGHLKVKGETGVQSEYGGMLAKTKAAIRLRAIDTMCARNPHDEIGRSIIVTCTTLKRGASFLFDAVLDDDCFSLSIDGLQRVEEASKLGTFHYVPILFHENSRPRKEQKLLLSLFGLLLGQIQGRHPSYGIIWHGQDCRPMKVRLNAPSPDAERLVASLRQTQAGECEPPLILNEHCKICEFQQRCRLQASAENNLSLIRGIGAKEIKRYARKGIFTVSQLAHTFRPRRKGKRSQRSHARQYALQAMAIRNKTIYTLGTLEVPHKPVNIYLDIEGGPGAGSIYLIGMIVEESGIETQYSFWADNKVEEANICDQFLTTIAQYNDFVLFFYGSYEQTFLKRLQKTLQHNLMVDRLLPASFNVLSVIYNHFYFPTFSNGLKDIGGLLGCKWSEPGASGIQSIVWRANWEATRDEEWKKLLIRYNLDDCAALKAVTDRICAIATRSESELVVESQEGARFPVASLHDIDKLADTRKWGRVNYVHPEYDYVNGCAYFNYQRQRVYVRTNKTLRKNKPASTGYRNRHLRVTRRFYVSASHCEACHSIDVIACKTHSFKRHGPRIKRAFDLVATNGGIKLSVIECRSDLHQCQACGAVFVPAQYRRVARYFHGVQSWAMYQHVAHGLSFGTIKQMIDTFFDLPVPKPELHRFKSMMAEYYRPTCNHVLERLLAGNLLHVDETTIKLKGAKGYVWAFTNMEEVIYMFKPNREGDFLRDLLKPFHGVLVSDFYAAYDSIDCPQQKCLVHLIRDMNDDLLANPFDSELHELTKPFGTLLRSIVESIDEHGLKKWHMRRFKRDATEYFKAVASLSPQSDAAQAVRQRLLKYQAKLFTFLDYDGVPWNNNNAENAIKHFAYYRARTSGMMTVTGINDFLTLLSICQTCRYKGISFWRFLLSRSQDIEAFSRRKRQSGGPVKLETYPEGYVTSFERISRVTV